MMTIVLKKRPHVLTLVERVVALAAIIMAAPAILSAQTAVLPGTYVEPGYLALDRKSPAEAIQEGFENARWRWRPVRVEPRFSIGNVGYYKNLLSTGDDAEDLSGLRASAGAGLTGYTRIGPKTFLSGFIAPEYTWWKDREELRQLNVNYGLGAYGAYNRVQILARGTSTEREQPLSGELDIPVQVLQEQAAFEVRLELRPRLFLEGSAAEGKVTYGQELRGSYPDVRFRLLDRKTEQSSILLARQLRNGFEVGIGFTRLTTDFLADRGSGRSSSETGPTLRLRKRTGRSTLDASVLARNVEFGNDEIEPFEKSTGVARLTYEIGSKTSASIYGFRELVYGVFAEDSTIEEYRWGMSLNRRLGRRFESRLFLETGEMEFRDPGGPNAGRIDDLAAWGASLRTELSRKLFVSLQFSEVDYDSTLADASRSTTRLGLGIELANLLPWQ